MGGGYSLHVYILQDLLFTLFDRINFELPMSNIYLYDYVYCPLLAAIMVSAYILISKILEKNYFFNRYIFGKI